MDTLGRLFEEYGLPLVFGAVFLEQMGPPIPSGPLLIVAGALAKDGRVSVLSVAGIAWVACMLGKIAHITAYPNADEARAAAERADRERAPSASNSPPQGR